MNKPISVGDLVVVVKASRCTCSFPSTYGHVFVVRRIVSTKGICSACGALLPKELAAFDDDRIGYGVHRLRRIPPLEELEGQRTEEKIHEPA